MFEFDYTAGQLFELNENKYAQIKEFSWIAGEKPNQAHIKVKMCLPLNCTKDGEWASVEPKFFVHREAIKVEDR